MMQCTYEQQFYLYVYFILYSEIATELRLNAKNQATFINLRQVGSQVGIIKVFHVCHL